MELQNKQKETLVWIQPSSETSYLPVVLRKSLSLCEPMFPHLWKVDNVNITKLLGELN